MSMSDMLRSAMKRPAPTTSREPSSAWLDSASTDSARSGADIYAVTHIALLAAASIQQWAETDDLDSGESYADRLMALVVGIADANQDGDITEDEQGVVDIALNACWDYLITLGVTEDDASALLNDWDEQTADRVRDLVASQLPDGEDAASAAIDSFVFSETDQEPLLDAAYHKEVAFRHGKKVRINKRISGSVRQSPKQKLSIRKAQMKSHSASAMMHRMKTMDMRHKAGM